MCTSTRGVVPVLMPHSGPGGMVGLRTPLLWGPPWQAYWGGAPQPVLMPPSGLGNMQACMCFCLGGGCPCPDAPSGPGCAAGLHALHQGGCPQWQPHVPVAQVLAPIPQLISSCLHVPPSGMPPPQRQCDVITGQACMHLRWGEERGGSRNPHPHSCPPAPVIHTYLLNCEYKICTC